MSRLAELERENAELRERLRRELHAHAQTLRESIERDEGVIVLLQELKAVMASNLAILEHQ